MSCSVFMIKSPRKILRDEYTTDSQKSKVRAWAQSVPSAVADGSGERAKLRLIFEYDRLTHPLPRTVLTVSKRDVPTFEAKPY